MSPSSYQKPRTAPAHAPVDLKVATAQQISKLPHFNPACVKLLGISIDGYSATKEFAEIFASDPSLAADLLVTANSAAFGASTEIETIPQALVFLGLERVRSLTATIALQLAVQDANPEAVRVMWSNGIATAVIAELLGTQCHRPGLYTAGLMHDMGRFGLLRTIGEAYVPVLTGTFDNIEDATRLERLLCGMDHCEAGACLAKAWGFPVGLQASMAAHHGDSLMSEARQMIRSACRLADALGFPEVNRKDVESAEELCAEFHFVPDVLRNQVVQRMQSLEIRSA
jgi:HD-like signal output (HDOD) protein